MSALITKLSNIFPVVRNTHEYTKNNNNNQQNNGIKR